MKAYIRVIYSSEGRSPAEVFSIMKGLGFHKLKGQPVFEGEVTDDPHLNEKLEELHTALRGMEVRYIPSLGAPSDDAGNVICDPKEALLAWRALGFDIDELGALLETDVNQFREKATALMKEHIESIVRAREAELEELRKAQEAEQAALREKEMQRRQQEAISDLLAQEGGVNFNTLHASSKMDPDELTEMLHDMINSGKVRAEQKGKRVVYTTV